MKVLWAEMFPFEIKSRIEQYPVVFLPLGLCEPHGQISALGLDTYKAEYICVETAKRTGGVVAPSMGYHIHESGPSARWLEEQVGENNPFMTSVSPTVFFHFLLYQLRAFYNAGFRTAIMLSGHGGAHHQDLKKIVGYFVEHTGMQVWYGTDFELTEGRFEPDHAGKYEISFLLHVRPDLIRFELSELEQQPGCGGRLALAANASEATPEYGHAIVQCSVEVLSAIVRQMSEVVANRSPKGMEMLTYQEVEHIWGRILSSPGNWSALSPRHGQSSVSEDSRWKTYEYVNLC